MNAVHPKKLLLTKWTAVLPLARDKHFLVARVILPEPPATRIDEVEIEAVHSGAAGASPGENCATRPCGARAGSERGGLGQK